jgi:chromosomal replication initiator protein
MYVLREKANLTYVQIGAEFGNRDHSTVMSAIKNVEKNLKNVDNYAETLKNLMNKL